MSWLPFWTYSIDGTAFALVALSAVCGWTVAIVQGFIIRRTKHKASAALSSAADALRWSVQRNLEAKTTIRTLQQQRDEALARCCNHVHTGPRA